jgi:hypothetical protein
MVPRYPRAANSAEVFAIAKYKARTVRAQSLACRPRKLTLKTERQMVAYPPTVSAKGSRTLGPPLVCLLTDVKQAAALQPKRTSVIVEGRDRHNRGIGRHRLPADLCGWHRHAGS